MAKVTCTTHTHTHTHTHTCATCSVLALSTTFRRCASFSSLAIARGEDRMSPLALPCDCRGGGRGEGRGWEEEGTHYMYRLSTEKHTDPCSKHCTVSAAHTAMVGPSEYHNSPHSSSGACVSQLFKSTGCHLHQTTDDFHYGRMSLTHHHHQQPLWRRAVLQHTQPHPATPTP